MDHRRFVRPSAMAGVRGSNFFTFRFSQGQAKRAVRTAPIVDGQASPTEGNLGIVASGKGQRSANLIGTHAPRRPIAPLDRRGIGRAIAQLVKHLLNAALCTMGVADIQGHNPLAFPMLHDLDMRQRPGNTIAQVGKASPFSLAAGAIGLAENLRE